MAKKPITPGGALDHLFIDDRREVNKENIASAFNWNGNSLDDSRPARKLSQSERDAVDSIGLPAKG